MSAEGRVEPDVYFRTLVDASPAPVFRTDPHGAAVEVNHAWSEHTGLRREDALGSGWALMFHLEDRERLVDQLRAALKSGSGWRTEARIVDADGSVSEARIAAEPVRAGDVPVGLVVMVIDFTIEERLARLGREREIAATLDETRALFEGFFVDSPAGLGVLDADIRYRYVNPQLAEINGASSEEHIGKTPIEALGDFGAAFERGLRNVFEERKLILNRTVQIPRAGTLPGHYAYSTFVISNSVDVAIGVGVVVIEITDRVRAFEELEGLRGNLEVLVEERTAELHAAQRDLVRQERLATLGRLLGTVSHELRNPLGTIKNSVHVLRAGVSDPPGPVDRALGRIDRSVTRCDDIIGDLFSFARVQDVELRSVDLDGLVAEVVAEFDVPDAMDVEVGLGSVGAVSLDAERVRRSLINVLANACDAMTGPDGPEERQAMLNVSTRLGDGRVEIVVEDNGVGLSPDALDQVFEPLFSTKAFGVGLGMPIVKQTLEQHGGGVDIESEHNVGTTVTLWLPKR